MAEDISGLFRDNVASKTPPWAKKRSFVTIESVEQLGAEIDKAIRAGICAVDTETEGLDLRVFNGEPNHKLVGFSFCYDKNEAFYVPVRHKHYDRNLPVEDCVFHLDRLIKDCVTWWYHAKFDHEVLFLFGCDNQPFLCPRKKVSVGPPVKWQSSWEDWALAYVLCYSGLKKTSLKNAAIHFLDPEMTAKDVQFKLDQYRIDIGACTGEQLLAYVKKNTGWVHRPVSRAATMRYFPELARIPDRKLKDILDSITFKMLGLKEVFTDADLYRSGGALDFSQLTPTGLATIYAGSDAMVTLQVGQFFSTNPEVQKILSRDNSYIYNLEKAIVPMFRQMERYRIRIDQEKLRRFRDDALNSLDEVVTTIRAEICEELRLKEDKRKLADNIETMPLAEFLTSYMNNPEGISRLFFVEIGVPTKGVTKTAAKGMYSTKADQIETLSKKYGDRYPFIARLSQYRSYTKLISTYFNPLVDGGKSGLCGVINGEARFGLRSIGAPTGRMSSGGGVETPEQGYTGINILSAPSGKKDDIPHWMKNYREGFTVPDGFVWLSSDYSGEELRISANYHQEPKWIHTFTVGDGDMHALTARDVYHIPEGVEVPKPKRQRAKNYNFQAMYGGGIDAYIRTIGGGSMSREEAARRQKDYFLMNPRVKAFQDNQFKDAKRDGGVWTAFGRWCPVPDALLTVEAYLEGLPDGVPVPDLTEYKRKTRIRVNASKRDSINYTIQGTGADILKISLLLVWIEGRKRGWISEGWGWENDLFQLLVPVHDEINFAIHKSILVEAAQMVEEKMLDFQRAKEKDWPVKFAVETTVGPDWKRQFKWDDVVQGNTKSYEPGGKNERYAPFYYEYRAGVVASPEPVPVVESESSTPEPVKDTLSLKVEVSGPDQTPSVDFNAEPEQTVKPVVEPEPVVELEPAPEAPVALSVPPTVPNGDPEPDPTDKQQVDLREVPEGTTTFTPYDRFIFMQFYDYLKRIADGTFQDRDGSLRFVCTLRRGDLSEWTARKLLSIADACPGQFLLDLRLPDNTRVTNRLTHKVNPLKFIIQMDEYNL